MKKIADKIILSVILSIALLSLMTFISCGEDKSDDNNSQFQVFPSPKGILTITELNDFNDKYVYAYGVAGGKLLTGLTDITGYPSDIAYKLVKISGGKALIPLYMANESASSYSNSYTAYNGNDTVSSFNILILNESSLKTSNLSSAINSNLGRKTLTSGTFSNGNMAIEWENILKILLTENISSNPTVRKLWYKSADKCIIDFFERDTDDFVIRLKSNNHPVSYNYIYFIDFNLPPNFQIIGNTVKLENGKSFNFQLVDNNQSLIISNFENQYSYMNGTYIKTNL